MRQIKNDEIINADFRNCRVLDKADVILTDPPYNIGHKYGGVNDSLKQSDYVEMMKDFVSWSDRNSKTNSHLFVIHYPQFFFFHGLEIIKETKYNYNHQIRWCYPSNVGQSKKKWSRSSREILWLMKGEPYFNPKNDPEPYQNPNDKRIKELIKNGSSGRSPYDWWVINLQKNVGKDYAGYSNQLPTKLLERIIKCSSKQGQTIGDPFAGTGSTYKVANRIRRKSWGIDANKEAPCLKII